MTGPEHYRQAERLLAAVNQRIGNDDRNEYVQTPSRRSELTAQAQVHATLAHAAATVDLFALYGQAGEESQKAWRDVVAPAARGGNGPWTS